VFALTIALRKRTRDACEPPSSLLPLAELVSTPPSQLTTGQSNNAKEGPTVVQVSSLDSWTDNGHIYLEFELTIAHELADRAQSQDRSVITDRSRLVMARKVKTGLDLRSRAKSRPVGARTRIGCVSVRVLVRERCVSVSCEKTHPRASHTIT
jgi:hypothetical protein